MKKSNSRFLKISSPCQEDWGKMTPVDNGRHCNQCDKTVIDLTRMSAFEIGQVLKLNSGSICARMYKHQEGEYAIPSENGGHRTSKLIAASLAVLAGLSTQGQDTYVDNPMSTEPFSTVENQPNSSVELPNDSTIINLLIIDRTTGETIPQALVRCNKLAGITNFDGELKFKLPQSSSYVISTKSYGYEDQTIKLQDPLPETIIIELEYSKEQPITIVVGGI